jgi:hypothetical protein
VACLDHISRIDFIIRKIKIVLIDLYEEVHTLFIHVKGFVCSGCGVYTHSISDSAGKNLCLILEYPKIGRSLSKKYDEAHVKSH